MASPFWISTGVPKREKREMDSSNCIGIMAVIAVSSSVAFMALQAQKHLLSEFIKKLEMELGGVKKAPKKKVRFAPDVIEPSSNSKEYRRHHSMTPIKQNRAMSNSFMSLELMN
ncbi:uncharacterized protein LOC103707422 [Phoenix dactylifera]|uniref:Uncharacterized protein LOC103707422 n=1 Tax=Phoenix dactylifera TaxID=42345 RepID=A0A8B7C275_PHODC|nr:uncharacterized protein LOC103707422 [Phoenix dactylifera]